MQTLLEIPLFRTALPAVATQASPATEATTPGAIESGDLTDYVGHDVDADTWAALQAECHRRYGGLWTIYADQVGDLWHVTRLHAKPGPVIQQAIAEGDNEFLAVCTPDWAVNSI